MNESGRRWAAMGVLLAASFMNLVDVTIVNVAIPSMQAAFGASESAIAWVVTAYLLTFALGLLPGGRLGDIRGRREMFMTGVALFTAASLLCGIAPTVDWLVAARVLQALGAAAMVPQTLAIVPAIFPPEQRGAAFALFGLSAGLATVSGPVIGGVLLSMDIAGLGWRPIFLINLPIGLVALAAAMRLVPPVSGSRSLRNDWRGILLATLTLLCFIFPLVEGRERGWPLWCFAMMAASLPLGWLLVRGLRAREAAGRAVLLPASLLRNRPYACGALLASVLFSGVPGFFFVLAQFLQNGFGLTPLASGLTAVPFSIGVLVASLVSGRLGSRWPYPRIVIGALALALAMGWLRVVVAHVDDTIDWFAFARPLLLGGLGLGTTIAPLFDTILRRVPAKDTGGASGGLQAIQQVGAALGVAIVAELFYGRLDGGASHADFVAAFLRAITYELVVFTVIALASRVLFTTPSGATSPTEAPFHPAES